MSQLPLHTIMPGAAPYFHRGGAIGCLCLHGFTASPHEVLWLAQHLAAEGHTVYAPRLAGHGTQPQDLARITWQDWLNSAFDAYNVLRQQCEQVFVCGLSMGALLTLLIAAAEPLDGAVVIAAPLLLSRMFQPRRLHILKVMRPYTDHTDRTAFAQYIADEQRRRGEPVLGRVRYGLWSTAGVEQLARLVEVVVGRLGDVHVPLLALYSEADATVSTASLSLFLERVSSPDIESHIFKRSGHILTQDSEHPEVFRHVAEFITKYTTSTAQDS